MFQEIIVGRPDGACVPYPTTEVQSFVSKKHQSFFQENGGKPFPAEHVQKASEEMEEFCYILEQEGVTVKRPDHVEYNKSYETPDFKSRSGMVTMPR